MSGRQPISFGDFYAIAWSMVPAVWRTADDAYGKSLQLLVYTMCQHMYYYFYNRAVHMDELFDPDLCPDKYLKFLSGMVGWTLIGTDPTSWREQIKAAPLLYKLKGTKRGLLLAEKLIGYSIFISELYRDHIGDIVPKERIFNNTPDNIKLKPWFRTNLKSLEGELLPGRAESDQFESYNSTNMVKLDAMGSVIRPRILSKTRKLIFTTSSTTTRYNNITGSFSLARYAKLPRLNIVLQYNNDLDTENPDGSVKQNNFTGALDLLLQFKPFHVLIQNLEVRYDLSEFIFDQTAINTDTITSDEETEAAVVIKLDGRAENTVNYSSTQAIDLSTPANETPASPLDNRGVISSIYQIVDLSSLVPEKENLLSEVLNKSLPVKSFHITDDTTIFTMPVNNNKIITLDDFSISISTNLVFSTTGKTITRSSGSFLEDGFLVSTDIVCSNTSLNNTTYTISAVVEKVITLTTSPVNESILGTVTYTKLPNNPDTGKYIIINPDSSNTIYNPGHSIIQYNLYNLISNPILDFKTMLSSQHDIVDFVEVGTTPEDGYNKLLSNDYTSGLNSDNIINISISNQPYRSSVTTVFDTQELIAPSLIEPEPLSRPWDLREIQIFVDGPLSQVVSENYVAPGYVVPGYIVSNNDSSSALDTFKNLYNNSILIVLETLSGEYIKLENNIDYYFDNTKNIFLNSSAIAVKVSTLPNTYNFLLTSRLHILYLSRTTYENATELGILSRGFRYISRINTKFSRQYLINSLPQQSLSSLMTTKIVSVDGKTKEKVVLGIKAFETPTNIYNRSSLKNDIVDNINVVSRYPLNRIDKSKWTVYSPEYSAYYLGDQKITNNWWGNYYGAKFDSPQVPYSDIDTSEEAQLSHVSSDQWLSALQTYNVSDPNQFLVTRTADENRKKIWNRSSCKFASVPFIRSRRDNIQVFRSDIPTFTRTEESTDYLVDTSVPPRLDNYKYILSDGTDVSRSYFSPGFSIPEQVLVTMDRSIGEKATLDSTGYGLSFPASDTYYNNYSSDVSPETYFTQLSSSEYVVKTSLYAGNIPINLDPSLNQGITDSLDNLDLLITNLVITTDDFVVESNETLFTLSQSSLFVNWVGIDTGNIISFGYYAPINTIPNIKVFLNGILLEYKTQWTAIFDRIKSIQLLVPTDTSDTVKVVYQVMPGINENISVLPLPQIPYTINTTLITNDIDVITSGNRYMLDLPVQSIPPAIPIYGVPCVSWYNTITNDYISSGISPVDYQPFAQYAEASPNMLISLNGIAIKYKQDWLFLLKMENDIVIASIALSPGLSLTLGVGDTITVEYFSEL